MCEKSLILCINIQRYELEKEEIHIYLFDRKLWFTALVHRIKDEHRVH